MSENANGELREKTRPGQTLSIKETQKKKTNNGFENQANVALGRFRGNGNGRVILSHHLCEGGKHDKITQPMSADVCSLLVSAMRVTVNIYKKAGRAGWLRAITRVGYHITKMCYVTVIMFAPNTSAARCARDGRKIWRSCRY